MVRSSAIFLRKAEPKDSDVVLSWRNDPEAIRQSVSGSAVESAVHQQWFKRALESSKFLVLIAEAKLEGAFTPIGMCRFDSVKPSVFSVSINVGPDFRGKGVGGIVLRSAISFLREEVDEPLEIQAIVRQSNSPSLRLFEKTGFSVFGEEAPWMYLRLARESA